MVKDIINEKLYSNPLQNLNSLDYLTFAIKLILFVIAAIILILINFFLGRFVKSIRNNSPIFFHKFLLWTLSINVEIEGQLETAKNCNLFVSNHISYLDIPILGSNFPLRFVAKSEVASWGIFGFLAKLAQTIFIKRNKNDTFNQKQKLKKLLLSNEKILIFPEGTTSDGNRVLDFKSSSFSAVEKENFRIQPITLVYSEFNGIPINRWLRPILAWYGDMDLKPHLSFLVNLRPIKVKLIFSDPVKSEIFSNRKDLNNYLQEIINTNYVNSKSNNLHILNITGSK